MEITERSLHDYRNCFSGIWLGTINFDYQILMSRILFELAANALKNLRIIRQR